jgi:hypothetical protein
MAILRNSVSAVFLILITLPANAQLTDVMSTLKAFTPDTSGGWEHESAIFLNTSQTSLTNWSSGGRNSLSLNVLVSLDRNYRAEKANWDNSLEFGYGIMNQGDGEGFLKTDDKLDIATKYGFRTFEKWYFSALMTLRTQVNPGYYYPNDSVVISRFLAPGYFVGAIGMDFKPSDAFSAFISPLTTKTTFVLDDVLSDSGAFGVERGRISRSEIGGFVRMLYRKDLVENVSFDLKIDLFSNYLRKPGNIDINWEMRLILKAYKMLSASLSTHLIYDDDVILDIDFDKDGIIDKRGPRLQFKELFSLGLTFRF